MANASGFDPEYKCSTHLPPATKRMSTAKVYFILTGRKISKKKEIAVIQLRNINKIYEAMCRALKKVYIGEGLYLDINRFSIVEPDLSIEECETGISEDLDPLGAALNFYEIEGRFGREKTEDRPDLAFSTDFTMTFYQEDSYDFIEGVFYQIIMSSELSHD